MLVAMATVAVANPVHSRPGIAANEPSLERRGTPGGVSLSHLQAVPNPLARRAENDDLAGEICKLLARKEVKPFFEEAKKLGEQIEKEQQTNPSITNLKDVLVVFADETSTCISESGKKALEKVKDELNKGKEGLGDQVQKELAEASTVIETALTTFAFQIAACIPQ
ncbi:hypothetical protein BGZ70_001792 [Mortierella alpina]|uniref:Uncharacterized protein n=1 Tax=Mortierella alpina TaxID=64518 RepID=A0A9P6IVM4_MORAP|nr:hypothetical protein BGZ70_001792 [Mortierella alpina]